MRHLALILAMLAGGMGLTLVGCGGSSASPEARSAAAPLPGGGVVPAARGPAMFQLRVVRLQARVRAGAPIEDIWRLLGPTSAPPEKRLLWEANDLRLGDGARLAADRLNELAADTADHTAHTTSIMVQENMDFFLSVGPERESLDLLWTEEGGKLFGRRFDKTAQGLRIVCRGDPEDPAVVRIALVPEVDYGPEMLRWVRNDTGAITQQMGRATFTPGDMAIEVRLTSGRLLALGGRRGSELSFGGVMFNEKRGPDSWAQTILIVAERVRSDAKPGAPPSILPGFVPAVPTAAPTATASPLPIAPPRTGVPVGPGSFGLPAHP
jgi:hypothetical protein